MARKWGWFSAVKKVISPADSKKDQKNHNKLKAAWSAEPADLEPAFSSKEEPTFDVAPPLPSLGTGQEEINEEIKQDYSVDDTTTTVAAHAATAIADAQATAEEVNVHLTSPSHYLGKTKEEIAAIKIQTAFRGYLARTTLHALRGLTRLTTLMQGHSAKQQAAASLRCMQTLAKVQSQIWERRIRMSEENQSLQRQLQRKHEKELNEPQTTVGEEWDDSTKSKAEIEARQLDRKEAAMRRERARTYSSLHQQRWKKASTKSGNRTFVGSMNPDWSWSWSWGERWMGGGPWDNEREEVGARRGSSVGQKPSRHHSSGRGGDVTEGAESRRGQHHRRHSIAGLSVRDDEGSSSGKAKSSKSPPAASTLLYALSPSASKRHSCPPHIRTFLLNQKPPLHSHS